MESNKTEEDKEGRFVSGTVIDALHVAKRVFQISADFTTLAHIFRANDALDERECVLKQHIISMPTSHKRSNQTRNALFPKRDCWTRGGISSIQPFISAMTSTMFLTI
jgi:hypothetical protein